MAIRLNLWYNIIETKKPKEPITMLRTKSRQLSFYSSLYHRIPKNHILKRINSAISLNFVNNALKDKYCSNFGRPAKEPEMLVRILIIQYLYNLSDEQVINEINVNLAFMEFIGIEPDEDVPCASLLSIFRTTKLDDVSLDYIISEIVRQCIEKNIIKADDGISMDTTHIEANTIKKVPERVMKHLAKKIFKEMDVEPHDIPDYTEIEDHKEAKRVMKEALENIIEEAGENAPNAVAEAKEVLESDLFIEQKGIRSLTDKDARVGNKSKTKQFFGYKAEIAMTNSGIITAVTVNPGNYVDGTDFEKIYKQTEASGLNVTEFYGDKAYFRKDILTILCNKGIIPYIPVSVSAYKINEELYTYTKDSDTWSCVMGNDTFKKIQRTEHKNGKEWIRYKYYFEREKCRNCPKREECIGKSKTVGKVLDLGENTSEYYEHSQWSKTEEFKEGYKKRAKIEPKNAEIKRFHGLDRARGYGLKSVSTQTKLTIIAVNLKRICKLVSASPTNHKLLCWYILKCTLQFGKYRESPPENRHFLSGLEPSPCLLLISICLIFQIISQYMIH